MNLFDHFPTETENYQQGERLFRRGSVSVVPSLGRERALYYGVGSTPAHTVTLFANGTFACTCGETEGLCMHAVAAILKAREDGRLVHMQQENELALGEQMLVALGRAMPGGETIRLQATLRLYGDGRVGLAMYM